MLALAIKKRVVNDWAISFAVLFTEAVLINVVSAAYPPEFFDKNGDLARPRYVKEWKRLIVEFKNELPPFYTDQKLLDNNPGMKRTIRWDLQEFMHSYAKILLAACKKTIKDEAPDASSCASSLTKTVTETVGKLIAAVYKQYSKPLHFALVARERIQIHIRELVRDRLQNFTEIDAAILRKVEETQSEEEKKFWYYFNKIRILQQEDARVWKMKIRDDKRFEANCRYAELLWEGCLKRITPEYGYAELGLRIELGRAQKQLPSGDIEGVTVVYQRATENYIRRLSEIEDMGIWYDIVSEAIEKWNRNLREKAKRRSRKARSRKARKRAERESSMAMSAITEEGSTKSSIISELKGLLGNEL